jgi:hypothetical protein
VLLAAACWGHLCDPVWMKHMHMFRPKVFDGVERLSRSEQMKCRRRPLRRF